MSKLIDEKTKCKETPLLKPKGRGSRVPTAFRTGGGGAARIPHLVLPHGQRQRVHRRRVSALLPSNLQQAGVCGD